MGWGGGPCPSPKNWVFEFFRLGLDLGFTFGPVGMGLDNIF